MTDIRLGSINGSHGVRGWVKVFSYTDPAEAILDYSPWILKKAGSDREVKVSEGRQSGKRIIARLEGIETRDQADELIGYEIHIDRETLPELDEGYYWFQLEGLTVRNSRDVVLGVVDHLVETGANDVLVVAPSDASVDDRERLVPFVEGAVVLEVDRSAGEILVDWEVDY